MEEKKNLGSILSAGSVDNKFATCAAEASSPTTSSGASSERSATSNPANPERAQKCICIKNEDR
jgi:hypothetical protein